MLLNSSLNGLFIEVFFKSTRIIVNLRFVIRSRRKLSLFDGLLKLFHELHWKLIWILPSFLFVNNWLIDKFALFQGLLKSFNIIINLTLDFFFDCFETSDKFFFEHFEILILNFKSNVFWIRSNHFCFCSSMFRVLSLFLFFNKFNHLWFFLFYWRIS